MSRMMTKAELLALFNSATECPDATDWRALAGQLAAALGKPTARRKPPASDATDAAPGEMFAPWVADAPTGRQTAKGAVTVTFADGWSRTFNMRAGMTPKGRKPWSIGPAVRFAVLCWKLAACRRVTGSDSAMYYDHQSRAYAGKTRVLESLLSCPDISDVIEADGEFSVAGASRWNPAECNAETAAMRAGAVDLSTYGEDIEAARVAVAAAHDRLAAPYAAIDAACAQREAMRERTKAAARRALELLYPWEIETEASWSIQRRLSDAFGARAEHCEPRTTPHGAELSDYQIPAPAPVAPVAPAVDEPAPVVEDIDDDAAIFDAAPDDDGDLSEDDAPAIPDNPPARIPRAALAARFMSGTSALAWRVAA